MSLEPGTMLGHYEIRSLIGVGGMGEVYRAHDHKLARDVALKVLPEAFARDPERIARFRREARLLAALNHTNIASIYGFEEDKGKHFLVMELVEGDTLREQIIRDGAASAEEVVGIGELAFPPVADLNSQVSTALGQAATARTIAILGVLLGAAGIALGAFGLMKKG